MIALALKFALIFPGRPRNGICLLTHFRSGRMLHTTYLIGANISESDTLCGSVISPCWSWCSIDSRFHSGSASVGT